MKDIVMPRFALPYSFLLVAVAVPGTASIAVEPSGLSFRELEYQQPRDPLLESNPVFTDIHHSSQDQLDAAAAALTAALPNGTPRVTAEATLRHAGAHCATKGAFQAEACSYADVQTVDEYIDDVRWNVQLRLVDDKVAGLSVDRQWQRH